MMQQDLYSLFSTGRSVRIEFNDGSGKIVCQQAIVGTNNHAVIELLFELNDLPILNPGSELIMVAQSQPDRPAQFYKARVVDVYFGKAAIYVSNIEPVDMTSLRKHFRFDVSIPVKLEMDTKVYGGHTKNLSAGGMLVGMPVREEFKVGRRLTCCFSLTPVSAPLVVRGEIVRMERIEKDRMGVAIRFLSLHEKNQNEIIQYLFRCQRELLQKKGPIKEGRL